MRRSTLRATCAELRDRLLREVSDYDTSGEPVIDVGPRDYVGLTVGRRTPGMECLVMIMHCTCMIERRACMTFLDPPRRESIS